MNETFNIDNFTGVIPAGGQSRRMGRNKAMLKIGNHTIVERVLAALKEVTATQLLVTNSPEEYAFLNIHKKSDIFPKKGALGGIYTGLAASETPYCLVVACDMPFVNPKFLQYMAQRIEGYDIVIPQHSKGYEPLCAIYAKTCMPHIEALFLADCLKIIEVFPRVSVRIITETEIHAFDQDGWMFFNVNTEEDYQQALCVYKG
ncbi:MAG: molybdenum cofactor guanylyltransferase [Deltaproteobacteria bacterium]|nr:molybdenum cofactor guanylyltransferase [Deltaproteobacteria bacterium]